MVWKPRRSIGGLVGVAAILSVLAIDWMLFSRLMRSPVSLASFALALAILSSLPLLIFLTHRTYGFFNLRYQLDRNGLTITWADTQQVIPLGEIIRIVDGVSIKTRGVRWPGYWIGRKEVRGVGSVLFYATCPPAEQLLVMTPNVSYAISPTAKEEFIAAFEVKRRLGPTKKLNQGIHQARFRSWPIWGDRGVLLLVALGFLANLALFAYLCWRYPALPELLPLHWDASGQADRIGTRGQLFLLPIIGLATMLANCGLGFSIYGREKLGTYLLLGGAAIVQIFLWLAALNIIGR